MVFKQWQLQCELLLLTSILFLVFRCPFSKVEESFNTQATHDILHNAWWNYDAMVQTFDHLKFPGVVPRTFVGPLLLGIFTWPLKSLTYALLDTVPKFSEQLIMRSVLGVWLWWCYRVFTRSISLKFGEVNGIDTGCVVTLITLLQFHLPFYMSRTLPNTFALSGCLLAYSAWLRQRPILSLCLIGAFAVIFRCDLLVLLAPFALQLLISGEIRLFFSLSVGLSVAVACLAVTVCIDTYFWGYLFQSNFFFGMQGFVWPEGVVLLYNTVANKSSNWGTHVWHWYASNALPRALNSGYVLLLAGIMGFQQPAEELTVAAVLKSCIIFLNPENEYSKIAFDRYRRMIYYVFPAVSFVVLYSFLPHKELRFIFPAMPLFSLGVAVSLQRLILTRDREQPSSIRVDAPTSDAVRMHASIRWAINVALLILLASALVCYDAFLVAATENYSGGEAMEWLTTSDDGIAGGLIGPIHVYIAPSACMTGVTLFTQPSVIAGREVLYSKEENLAHTTKAYERFDWLLVSSQESNLPHFHDFEPAFTAKGFIGMRPNFHIRNAVRYILGALPSGASSSVDDFEGNKRWPYLPPYQILLKVETEPAIVVLKKRKKT
jgi:alpha-1,6-mannosyltransferase